LVTNISRFPSPEDAVVEERVALAQKVGRFLSRTIDQGEREATEQLAMLLAKDAADAVRAALASEVGKCAHLPIDIAKRISDDVEKIASPFLLEGDGLSDETLEHLARECEEQAREILARRKDLPEPASFAISELGQEQAVANLMDNQTANISERVCAQVITRFEENDAVLSKMGARVDLPMSVIENLINMVSEEIADELVKQYGLGKDMAAYVTGQAKVVALNASRESATDSELEAYFQRLNDAHELGDAVLLGVLQGGGMRQFEIAIAVRAGISREQAMEYLSGGKRAGFMDLLDLAKVIKSLESIMFEAFMSGRVLSSRDSAHSCS